MIKSIKHVGAALTAVLLLLTCLQMSAFADGEAAATTLDFSSKRIIVATEETTLLDVDAEHLVSSYNGIHILQFDTEEEAKEAYGKYAQIADFVEVDGGIAIAEGGTAEAITTDTVMTEEENPLKEIEGTLAETSPDTYDIALIDTGANDALKAVSVIGDSGADDHGHGDAMVNHIRSINPDARILSIKALDAKGIGDVSAVYAAMQVAIENHIKVISLSISAYKAEGSELIESAVKEAKEKGIIVVGAAGNNNGDAKYFIPGGIGDAVIAGACDMNGSRLEFSNFGATVDYYLPAGSTSEAAAKLSGIISRYGVEGIDAQIEQLKTASTIVSEDGKDKTGTYLKDGDFEVAWIGGSTGDWDAASFHYITDDNGGNARVAYCLDNGVIPPRNAAMYWFNLTTNKAIIGHILYHGSASNLNDRFSVQIAVWMARGYSPYEATGYAAESPWELAYIYNGYSEAAANAVVNKGVGLYNAAVTAVNTNGETFWADCVDAYWPSYENVQGLTAMVAGWNPNGYLKLHKASSNPVITNGNRCYSLADAEYTIYQGSTVKGTLTTDANGDTPVISLPLGNYTVKETKAAPGYELNPRTESVTITANHTSIAPALLQVTDTPGNDPAIIEITKESNSDYATQYPLVGAQFEIKYYDNTVGDISGTPKKTWVIETKETAPGVFRASLMESFKVSGDDFYLDSGVPVLPIGTVSVEEIKPAMGYTLTGATIKDNDGNDIPLTDGKYIGIITMTNGMAKLNYGNFYTMLNTPIEVHTLAVNKANGTHYAGVDGPVTIVDTVTMKGTDCERLVNEQGEWDYIKYRLKSEMRILGTDEVIASGEKSFITDDFDGHTEDITLVIEDPSRLEGKTVYVAEYLYSYVTKNEGGVKTDVETLVACEDESVFPDVDDDMKETQRIHFPKIGTTLTADGGENETTVQKDLTLTDTVSYESLLPGKEYMLKGTLMDKETGRPVLDDGGNEITAEKTFVPQNGSGTTEITFTFPSVTLHGKTVVAFEELWFEGTQICTHADIEDEDQTVELFPVNIGTTFTEKETGEHLAYVAKELTLEDSVAYENVAVGAEYTVKGTVMDKETGNPLLDAEGNAFTLEKTFIPEETEGSVILEFTIPAESVYDGKTLVAFEELWYGSVLITEHKDLEDEGQTVEVKPVDLKTTLTDDKTHIHAANGFDEITLTDTVRYTGLVKGKKYTVKGVLMMKTTGEEALDENGERITSEAEFEAEDTEGTVELTFTFKNRELMGDTLVAFETLFEADTQLADHEDLEDEDQSVKLPFIGTKLTKNDLSVRFYPVPGLHLNDEVSLKNLDPDTKYLLRGYLVDKKTGYYLLKDGSEVKEKKDASSSEVTFEAEKEDETQTVPFVIDASSINYDIVCFEELYVIGSDESGNEIRILVAEHSDINDAAQTVQFEEAPKTGDVNNILFWTFLALGAMLTVTCGIIYNIKKKEK